MSTKALPPGSRRHHLVPAFYLAAFTDMERRDGYLTVTDLERGIVYRGRPDSVAYRNNYNTLISDGTDPDSLERVFADIERAAAPAIYRVLKSATPPVGEDLRAILALLAIQVVRAPRHRDSIARLVGEISQRVLEIATSTPEVFASCSERVEAAGIDLGGFQEMREFVRSSEVRVADNDWLKVTTLEPLEVIVHTMRERNWSLLAIPDGADYSFVTTEHPLKLRWTDSSLVRGPYPPGFGVRSTRVTFPLGPRAMLSGELEGRAGLSIPVDKKLAALLNTNTIMGSTYIYSSDDGFVWARGEEIRRGAESLLREARSARHNSETPGEDQR